MPVLRSTFCLQFGRDYAADGHGGLLEEYCGADRRLASGKTPVSVTSKAAGAETEKLIREIFSQTRVRAVLQTRF